MRSFIITVILPLILLHLDPSWARLTCMQETDTDIFYSCDSGYVLAPGMLISSNQNLIELIKGYIGQASGVVSKASMPQNLQYRYLCTCVPASSIIRLCPGQSATTVYQSCGLFLPCDTQPCTTGTCSGQVEISRTYEGQTKNIFLYVYDNPSFTVANTDRVEDLYQLYYKTDFTNRFLYGQTPQSTFIIGFQVYDAPEGLLSWNHYESCWQSDDSSGGGSNCGNQPPVITTPSPPVIITPSPPVVITPSPPRSSTNAPGTPTRAGPRTPAARTSYFPTSGIFTVSRAPMTTDRGENRVPVAVTEQPKYWLIGVGLGVLFIVLIIITVIILVALSRRKPRAKTLSDESYDNPVSEDDHHHDAHSVSEADSGSDRGSLPEY